MKKDRYISFTTKLCLIYAVLLIIPLTLITTISYNDSTDIMREQAIYTNEQSLDQAASYLEYQMSSISSMLSIISYDPTVQILLLQGSQYARGMENNWFVQTTDVQNFIYNPYVTNEIRQVQLYPVEGEASFSNTPEFQSLSDEEKAALSKDISGSPLFYPVWIPSFPHEGVISLVKRVPDFSMINKNIGIIRADVPRSVFQTIIEQASAMKESIVFLVNSAGQIIAENYPEIGKEAFLSALSGHDDLAEGSLSEIDAAGTGYIGGFRTIKDSDWTLAVFVPMKAIFAPSDTFSKRLMLCLASLIALSLLFSVLTSRKLTGRILRLQEHIAESERSVFSIGPIENGDDEIGELTAVYDRMAERIKLLLEDRFRQGYRIRNLELEVMQSTINPHFLYNSLDMICWSAMKNNDAETQRMSRALCRFYKLSLGRGRSLVELKDEIEHIQLYVSIQNMRFGDKIHLEVDVPEHLVKCTVFKIMLQPIVENAITHGILEKDDETGTITVKAWDENDDLLISVTDDGVGMDESTLASILSSERKDGGYGLRNINERIKLLHGRDYGLRFKSCAGKGTTVTIRLPLSKARWMDVPEKTNMQ